MSEPISVLFAPLAEKNPYQRNLAEGLQKHGVEVANFTKDYERTLRTLCVTDELQRHGKPDILHLHWTYPYTNPHKRLESLVLGFRFLHRLTRLQSAGIKIVWTVHNLRSHESVYPRVELFFLRRLARIVDALIVHCDSAMETVAQAYGLSARDRKKMFVTPHPSYIGHYPDEIGRTQARRLLGIDESDRVLLFFGQLRRYKGLDRLIEALKTLDAPSARLLIAGNPKSQHDLEDLQRKIRARKNITLHPGFVPDEDIQKYMNAADAVVLPFEDILTSGSALLAMSFGKPVIAPRIGCIPDLLDPQSELLYDPGETNGLRGALDRVLTSGDDELKRIGAGNRQDIGDLSWERMAEETLGVYRSLTGNR